MNIRLITFIFCLCAYATSACALDLFTPTQCRYFMSRVGFGASRVINNGSSQSVSPGPGWPVDTYTQNISHSTQYQLSIGGGYTVVGPRCSGLPYYSIFVEYSGTCGTKVSGIVEQYSQPRFQNYTYLYKLQRNTLMLNLKFDFYEFLPGFMPYVIGGIGGSGIRASAYKETPYPHVTPRISPGFGSNTSRAFSYMYGMGLDYVVTPSFWVGLELNYANYGIFRTGKGVNTPTLTGTNYSDVSLSGRLSSRQFVLYLTYFPDFADY